MMSSTAMLRLEYLSPSQLALQPPAWCDSLLGATCFGAGCLDPTLPYAHVDMPSPDYPEGICEIWHCSEALKSGIFGSIRYRQGATMLYGVLSRGEEAEDIDRNPLQDATESAYQEIFELLELNGYSAVLRFWNYFPGINRETHGMERYHQFNIGRQDAFLAHGRSVIENVPAACALGSATGALTVAFLAVRAEVTGLENHRQVSAFSYPDQYGPRSPTFARAGLVRLNGRDMLFISGTASIVGHQSLHVGDVVAQTRESMANIAAIVVAANQRSDEAGFDLADLNYKVYVRNLADMAAVKQEIEACAGAPVRAICLRADVCRSELLVEIEASGGHPLQFEEAGY